MWWRNYSIFFQILPYIQKASILVSQGLTYSYSVLHYILKRILHICIKIFKIFKIHKIFDKSLVNININNKSKKNEIAYSMARNLKTARLWSLNLD